MPGNYQTDSSHVMPRLARDRRFHPGRPTAGVPGWMRWGWIYAAFAPDFVVPQTRELREREIETLRIQAQELCGMLDSIYGRIEELKAIDRTRPAKMDS